MKKFMLCLCVSMISTVFLLSGCGVKLDNAPVNTSNMKVYGDALVYNDYVYFANAFKSNSSIEGGENNLGNVSTHALTRVALNNGKVEYEENKTVASGIEQVISKIAGSENSLMYSVDDYIFFASPNIHKNNQNENKFDYNSYFRIKTDGSGLKEFYTSSMAVTQQAFLNINGQDYLFLVDQSIDGEETTSRLVRIEIGSKIGKASVVVEDFNSIVFAKSYNNENDIYAYYTTDLDEEQTNLGSNGTYINKVNMLTGESIKINPSTYLNKTITLKSVVNGNLYFTMNEANGLTYYQEYSPNDSFSARKQITGPTDSYTINNMQVLISNTNNDLYYVFSVTASDTTKICALPEGEKDFASNQLSDKNATILFVDGDYVYYASETDGIYRTSVLDKEEQLISDKSSIKTTNIAFDGTYVYFYALSGSNSDSGTYYMYRANVNYDNKVELLSNLDNEDLPEDEQTDSED